MEQTSQKHIRKHRRSDSPELTASEEQMPAPGVKPMLLAPNSECKASELILNSESLSPFAATNISAKNIDAKDGSPGPRSVAYVPSYPLFDTQGVGSQTFPEPSKRVNRACDMCHQRKTKVSLASDLSVPLRFYSGHPSSLPEIALSFLHFFFFDVHIILIKSVK